MNFTITIRETTTTTRYETINAASVAEAEELAAEQFEGCKNDGFGGSYLSEVMSVRIEEDEDVEVF